MLISETLRHRLRPANRAWPEGEEVQISPKRESASGCHNANCPDSRTARLIWPWLVQMEPGRGWVCTYDWIENHFGLGMQSVGQMMPEYHNLKVGGAQQLAIRGPASRVAA